MQYGLSLPNGGVCGDARTLAESEFYQVREVTLLPTPVQEPRIPIWIGEGYPLKGPMRRRDPEQDRALIRSLAEVGATWWIEYIPPSEPGAMHEAIRRGPLRIE